eukprot:TRINITY_DN2841_c0_g1_i1.p1 TRINITY_DN2841_c0_g1~~TRINITY_DN2841_c0_g1_i1.p1  ORF type:complete len:213 (+),score=38.26 TRINITY_DN2841_c0_g1_i1:34-672(+)
MQNNEEVVSVITKANSIKSIYATKPTELRELYVIQLVRDASSYMHNIRHSKSLESDVVAYFVKGDTLLASRIEDPWVKISAFSYGDVKEVLGSKITEPRIKAQHDSKEIGWTMIRRPSEGSAMGDIYGEILPESLAYSWPYSFPHLKFRENCQESILELLLVLRTLILPEMASLIVRKVIVLWAGSTVCNFPGESTDRGGVVKNLHKGWVWE